MRRYEPSTPGVTLGLAALAMTAVAMSVLVIFPAETDVYDDPVSAVAAVLTAAFASAGAHAGGVDSRRASAALRCTSGRPGRTADG
ncbi:MAG TPA: hypothetical protein VMN79_19635 [Casimicrobiaceae bacterium]|nr:hypothetical protein [Casimicrobiaceae bacterium]